MDIKSLIECNYVTEVLESGSNIEFKTFLYSREKMCMTEVLIRCPVSGDFILTECAKIVGQEEEEEDNSEILKQLFITIHEASTVEKKINNNDIVFTPLEINIREASSIFIKENEIDDQNLEDSKFKFLAICSKNFSKIYEQNTKNKHARK